MEDLRWRNRPCATSKHAVHTDYDENNNLASELAETRVLCGATLCRPLKAKPLQTLLPDMSQTVGAPQSTVMLSSATLG